MSYFVMTNDVENFCIPLNREDPRTAEFVHKVGLPRVLDLYSKHDIPATFYFTGTFCELSPESIDLVKDHGHEIGCHGYDHSPNKAFDLLSLDEQINELLKFKKLVEPIAGKVESFRAPALRINKFTPIALEKAGFKTDSSIASQRFDGPFSFGLKKKLNWMYAPRCPYFMSSNSPYIKGNSAVLEIPVSSFIFPFIGTFMRITPSMTKILRSYLFAESNLLEKPIVFLFHPNECLDFKVKLSTARRKDNYVEYLFADLIRQKMKLKNLGLKSIKLLDDVIVNASKADFEFVTAKEYYNIYNKQR